MKQRRGSRPGIQHKHRHGPTDTRGHADSALRKRSEERNGWAGKHPTTATGGVQHQVCPRAGSTHRHGPSPTGKAQQNYGPSPTSRTLRTRGASPPGRKQQRSGPSPTSRTQQRYRPSPTSKTQQRYGPSPTSKAQQRNGPSPRSRTQPKSGHSPASRTQQRSGPYPPGRAQQRHGSSPPSRMQLRSVQSPPTSRNGQLNLLGSPHQTRQSATSPRSHAAHQVRPPKRFRPVQLFRCPQSREDTGEMSSLPIVLVESLSSDDSTPGNTREGEMLCHPRPSVDMSSSPLSPPSSLIDEVDSCLPKGQPREIVHVVESLPVSCSSPESVPAASKSRPVSDKGSNASSGRTEAEHQKHQQGAEHQKHQQGAEHQKHQQGAEHQKHQQGAEHQKHQHGAEHQKHQQGAEHQKHQQGHAGVLDSQHLFSKHTLNETFTVFGSRSPDKAIFQYRRVPIVSRQNTTGLLQLGDVTQGQKKVTDKGDNPDVWHDRKSLEPQAKCSSVSGNMQPVIKAGGNEYKNSLSKMAEGNLLSSCNELQKRKDILHSSCKLLSSPQTLCTPDKTEGKVTKLHTGTAPGTNSSPHKQTEMSPLCELQKKIDFLFRNLTPQKSSTTCSTPSRTGDQPAKKQVTKEEALSSPISKDSSKANQTFTILGKVAPKLENEVDPSGPDKCVFTNSWASRLFTSPLPLVKVESPQQWGKVKRRYHPTIKSLSTEEIQLVLKMPDTESVTHFLSQKFCKTEPELAPQEESAKSIPAPFPAQPSARPEHVGFRPLSPAERWPCVLKGRGPTVDPDCSQISRQHGVESLKFSQTSSAWSTGKQLSLCRNGKIAPPPSGAKVYSAPPKRVDTDAGGRERHLQSPHSKQHGTDGESENAFGIFRVSPGELFRQTIITPPQESLKKKTREDHEEKDHVLQTGASHLHQPFIHSVCRSREGLSNGETVYSSSFSSDLQHELNTNSSNCVFSKSSPFSLGSSQKCLTPSHFTRDNWTPKASAFSPASPQGVEKKRLSGSAIQQIFIQLKQASDTQKVHRPRGVAIAHICQEAHCRSLEMHSVGLQQTKTTRRTPFSQGAHTANARLTKQETVHMIHAPDVLATHQHDLLNRTFDCEPLAYQEQFHACRSSGGGTRNAPYLFDQVDVKGKSNDDNHHTSERSRHGACSLNTLSDFEDSDGSRRFKQYETEQLTRATAVGKLQAVRQKHLVFGKESPKTAATNVRSPSYSWKTLVRTTPEPSSHMPHGCVNSANHNGIRQSSPLKHRAPNCMRQHRTNCNQNLSAGQSLSDASPDSKSGTPPRRPLGANQSTTPSKLLSNLNLSDLHSPLNLTQNCDTLSRLVLASPPEGRASDVRGGKSSCNKVQSSGGRPVEAPVLDSCRPARRRSYKARLQELLNGEHKGNTLSQNCAFSQTEGRLQEPPHRHQTVAEASPKASASKLGSSPKSQPKEPHRLSESTKPSAAGSIATRLGHGVSSKSKGDLFSARDSATHDANHCQASESKCYSWKIFRSRNHASSAQITAKSASAAVSGISAASLQTATAECVLSKPFTCQGSKMIHISSPQARQQKGNRGHLFSLNSSDSFAPSVSTKRSFESEFDDASCSPGDTRSPCKRRRIVTIHSTSTPSKSTGPRPKKFDMNESLSTISGEDDSLNRTVLSTNSTLIDLTTCSATVSDDGEDEVTLISE